MDSQRQYISMTTTDKNKTLHTIENKTTLHNIEISNIRNLNYHVVITTVDKERVQ